MASQTPNEIGTTLISLLADGLYNQNQDLVSTVSETIEQLVLLNPEEAVKIFKAVTFIAAEVILEEIENGNNTG